MPEGLDSPTLSLLNATSVTVQWSSPSSPNGVILSYNLVVSTRTSTLTLDQGLALSTVLSDLSPFTLYLISVNVTNTEGSLVSAASNITTGETGENYHLTLTQLPSFLKPPSSPFPTRCALQDPPRLNQNKR